MSEHSAAPACIRAARRNGRNSRPHRHDADRFRQPACHDDRFRQHSSPRLRPKSCRNGEKTLKRGKRHQALVLTALFTVPQRFFHQYLSAFSTSTSALLPPVPQRFCHQYLSAFSTSTSVLLPPVPQCSSQAFSLRELARVQPHSPYLTVLFGFVLFLWCGACPLGLGKFS